MCLWAADAGAAGQVWLRARSDALFACFPGGGAEYGAHTDGGGTSLCTLTTIVYANPAWGAEDGGELRMLDKQKGEWRYVTPIAGRVAIFRADTVVHKVTPAHRQRFALTCWWF